MPLKTPSLGGFKSFSKLFDLFVLVYLMLITVFPVSIRRLSFLLRFKSWSTMPWRIGEIQLSVSVVTTTYIYSLQNAVARFDFLSYQNDLFAACIDLYIYTHTFNTHLKVHIILNIENGIPLDSNKTCHFFVSTIIFLGPITFTHTEVGTSKLVRMSSQVMAFLAEVLHKGFLHVPLKSWFRGSTGWPLPQDGIVWKCWVNIPNEIAI